ncbi:hypothetical protein OIU34_20515 [Pararhizobium sp. BT-229]|uniref:hypothetical protein n=1 Tax=Pararhizobium sp. BT-229 TaxID=2986923 RepID=UPI0021F778E8|nr:hypothetical protein [Pararhizobium sp. BT-229]MCV9964273.1 hypothetical protein [Pararhizobium sp. BT-229]
MKSLLLAAILAATMSGASTPATAEDSVAVSVQTADTPDVYCGDVPGKGYKCSDGTTANEARGIPAGEGLALLKLTARVEMTVCDNQAFMRYGSCTRKPYPDTDVLFVQKSQCQDAGRKLALLKHEELSSQGWKATIIWNCQ